jgi:hypothetical protein
MSRENKQDSQPQHLKVIWGVVPIYQLDTTCEKQYAKVSMDNRKELKRNLRWKGTKDIYYGINACH